MPFLASSATVFIFAISESLVTANDFCNACISVVVTAEITAYQYHLNITVNTYRSNNTVTGGDVLFVRQYKLTPKAQDLFDKYRILDKCEKRTSPFEILGDNRLLQFKKQIIVNIITVENQFRKKLINFSAYDGTSQCLTDEVIKTTQHRINNIV